MNDPKRMYGPEGSQPSNSPDGQTGPESANGYEWDYPQQPTRRPARPYSVPPLNSPQVPPPNPQPQYPPRAQSYPPRQPYGTPEQLSRPAARGAEYQAPSGSAGGSSNRGGRGWFSRLLLFILGTLFVFICGGGMVAGCAYITYANQLPSADQLAAVNTEQSTKIYDRNGGLLYEIVDPNLGRHTIIPPDRIPTVLKQATLATEDPSFYSNPGVDWYGVLRAIYYLVRYQRPVSGASTITQQLMKTVFLSPEQTPERKIKEAILALEVTRRYSKDQILAFYLNTINYGNRSYGIQAASQSYFAKDVEQLDLAEASLLAGLPQLPAIYDPCINPDKALERQMVVLGLMKEQGFITQAQVDAASQEMNNNLASDAFVNRCKAGLNYARAPHFVDYVRQQLEEQYGPEVVNRGGLQVYTTLDPQVQTIVEQEASKQIAALKAKNVKSAAVVVVNPRNGEILAMLGSVDFNDPKIDGQVNVAIRPRQPGSSIKPINYLTAFEKGWNPATPIYDLTTEFPNGSQPPYVPKNYDGKEHGLVTVRTALANSYNIPAVKTLYFVGVPDMISTAQRFGITTFGDPNRYGLALTLGGGEVRLTELTGAYATIANGGKRPTTSFGAQDSTLSPFTKIVDGTGRVVYDSTRSDAVPPQVTDARYAYLLENILSDNGARTPAFGANSPLKVSRPAFVKTGTTNDYRDNWTLGGTTELVIGVWVGNPRNDAMQGVSGVTGAAPIWHNVFERVYKETDAFKGIAPHDFPIPPGLVQAEVCNESGLVPTETCPANRRHSEIFLSNQAPNQFDDVWVKLKIDSTNGQLANDNCPADIVQEQVFAKLHPDPVLPYDKVQAWGAANGYPVAPTENSPCTNQVVPTPEPVSAKIGRPNEGDRVSGIVTVTGNVKVPDGGAWALEAGRAGRWTTIATGTSDTHGHLGQFDTALFGDGELDIRLTATDQYGHPTEDKVRVFIQSVEPTVHPTRTPEPTRKPKKTKIPPPTAILDTPTPEAPETPPIPADTMTPAPTVQPVDEPTATPTPTETTTA